MTRVASSNGHVTAAHVPLAASREAEAAVVELERRTGGLLGAGRQVFGVAGRFEYGPLRVALRSSGLRAFPAVLLGLLAAVGTVPLVAWPVMGGRMSSALGVGSLSTLLLVAILVFATVALPVVARVEAGSSRVRIAVTGGGLEAVALLLAALASGIWTLLLAAAIGGAGIALVHATASPLLMDLYRPEVRVRMFSLAAAVAVAATAGAVGLMAVAAGGSSLTWRSVLLVAGAVATVVALVGSRVREVTRDRWDGAQLAQLVRDEAGGLGTSVGEVFETDITVSGLEKLRQIMSVKSAGPVLALVSATGFVLTPLPVFVGVLFRDRFSLSQGDAVALMGLAMLGGLPGLAWFAKRGEIAFRSSPARLLQLAVWVGTLAAAALAVVAASPSIVPAIFGLAVLYGALAVLVPAGAVTLLTVVQPRYRPHAGVLLGLAPLYGAATGQQAMTVIGSRFGVQWALLTGALVILGSAAGLAKSIGTIEQDVDTVVGHIIEAAELGAMVSQGRHLPLLSCHRLDFSYGQLQVLFGVDFTVDDGEMVALLGTNGAGKSTLLRAISGLSFPDRGTIHFRGADITYAGADQRVSLGITQVPGGRAVFGPMTVIDNLRVFGYTYGRDRAAVEAGIDASFEAFPRLAERRNQLAATLSGGEQQMLGVSKAFILRPRLLLIDELSLGLAPVVVGELLEMVRRINAQGTAIVLVEQSVNIALSLVEHAYFMEKGEMRFDGVASELLSRPDLLRSVFLEGATKGIR